MQQASKTEQDPGVEGNSEAPNRARWLRDTLTARNWPISSKIYFLVLLGLLMFGVGVLVHLLQSDLDERAHNAELRYISLVEDSNQLASYALTLDKQQSASVNDLSGESGKLLPLTLQRAKALLSNMSKGYALRSLAEQGIAVDRILRSLDAAFKQLQGLLERIGPDEDSGIRGQLKDAVAQLERELQSWPGDTTRGRLQQAIRFEQAYRADQSARSLGSFHEAFRQLETAVDTHAPTPESRDRLSIYLSTYRQALLDFADMMELRAQQQLSLDGLMRQLHLSVEALRNAVFVEIKGVQAKKEQQRRDISWLLIGIGSAAALLFALASARIARSIYEPLQRIDGTMRRLAEGESNLQIPHMERADEIGAMARSIAVFRNTALEAERIRAIENQQAEEIRFLEITQAIASQLELDALLRHIVGATSELLGADRSSLFLFDERTGELYLDVALGLEDGEGRLRHEIRFPSSQGLAGQCFTTGETINIPDIRSSPHFNPEVDKMTGYQTRNILCMPVVSKDGHRIGVLQALNRSEGPFSDREEHRMRAFAAQVAITLENAMMFDDILTLKNYNESILKSLSNGVVTVAPNGDIVKINRAAATLIGVDEDWQGDVEQLFPNDKWIVSTARMVGRTGEADTTMDAEIHRSDGRKTSVNLGTVPLRGLKDANLGSMLILEDITGEKRVKATMARYMTKEVVDTLMEQGESLLGGTAQQASILFSDIRSFTTISETLGPRGTVSMLNDYFTRMVDVLIKRGGVLDKYIGDAIMAVFGAPLRGNFDADNAVTVANEMTSVLGFFNRERIHRGQEPIRMGIGIASGEVISGNIGSPKRMDYTVIGDPVNLASRLEGATKTYGAGVLFCADTQRQLRDGHVYREIDLLRVRGKTQPVAVFEGLNHLTPRDCPNLDEFLERYKQALQEYRKHAWQEAGQGFADALVLKPGDSVCQLYIERCQHFVEAPPPDDWDGVWALSHKK